MKHLPDALIVAGLIVVPYGISYWHLALAVVVAGLELVALGVVIARSR